MKAAAIPLLLVAALVGCNDTPRVTGKWLSPGTVVLNVQKNGNGLIVQEGLVTHDQPLHTSSATFNDNILTVDRGNYVVKYIYVEANDTLIMSAGPLGQVVFNRVTSKPQ